MLVPPPIIDEELWRRRPAPNPLCAPYSQTAVVVPPIQPRQEKQQPGDVPDPSFERWCRFWRLKPTVPRRWYERRGLLEGP